MDPTLLVSSAVSLLSPFVAKGAEEFAKDLGKEAAEKAKDLFSYLKKSFTDNSEEGQVLSLFEKKPGKYESALCDVIEERASSDETFASEVEKRVQSAGPYIKVIQKLKGAKDVTGAEVKKARTGAFDIRQESEEGEKIVGFKADEVG